MGSAADASHAQLMDSVYRGQRHIYDLTRKYYLFGRDRVIADLACQPCMGVLEIACGTGRNLEMVARRWPGVELYGVDISTEMLKNATARLGSTARFAADDACSFDPQQSLGRKTFDRVILSYSLSMIPDWQGALAHAASMLAPGGSLHVVDFGDLSGLASPLRKGLLAWLAKFHVTPRASLEETASRIAALEGLGMESAQGPFAYYRMVTLSRPPR